MIKPLAATIWHISRRAAKNSKRSFFGAYAGIYASRRINRIDNASKYREIKILLEYSTYRETQLVHHTFSLDEFFTPENRDHIALSRKPHKKLNGYQIIRYASL